jgi:hypothetical protein
MEYHAKNNKLTKNRMPYNGFIVAFISEDSKEKTQYSEAAASIPPSK